MYKLYNDLFSLRNSWNTSNNTNNLHFSSDILNILSYLFIYLLHYLNSQVNSLRWLNQYYLIVMLYTINTNVWKYHQWLPNILIKKCNVVNGRF